MLSTIEFVKLVTENCEVYVIAGADVFFINYSKVDEISSIYPNITSQMLGLGFKKDTSVLKDLSFVSSPDDWRIRTNITSVEFVFVDGTNRFIQLDWPDGEENHYLTQHPSQVWSETSSGGYFFTHFFGSDPNIDYTLIASDLYDIESL